MFSGYCVNRATLSGGTGWMPQELQCRNLSGYYRKPPDEEGIVNLLQLLDHMIVIRCHFRVSGSAVISAEETAI